MQKKNRLKLELFGVDVLNLAPVALLWGAYDFMKWTLFINTKPVSLFSKYLDDVG